MLNEDFFYKVRKNKIILIVITTIIIIGTIINYSITKTNTNKFYNCLKNNNLINNPINNEKNQTSYSTFNNKDYLINKEIINKEKSETTYTILYYNKKTQTIDGELSQRGQNKYNHYGLYLIQSKYNMKNNQFECITKQNDGFNTKCNILLKESKKFGKEIKKLIKSCDVNTRFISKKLIHNKKN